MKIIVCVDKNNGLMFNNRRLSKDKILIEKILEITRNNRLLMNEYSFNQFEENDNLYVSNDFLNIALENDFCFIENSKIDIKKVNMVYRFNWNRDYPADFYFNDLNDEFKLIYEERFEGFSHPEIILEVFKRE